MALKLKRRGIKNIRPLAGGLNEWQRLSLPVEYARAARNQSAS
jgi:hypothetical protein